jgi:hypothetical protein
VFHQITLKNMHTIGRNDMAVAALANYKMAIA